MIRAKMGQHPSTFIYFRFIPTIFGQVISHHYTISAYHISGYHSAEKWWQNEEHLVLISGISYLMHRDSCSPSVNPRGCNPHRFSYQHSVHLKRMLKQVDTYYEFVTAFYTFYLNVPFETWTLLVQINRKIAEKFRNFGNFFFFYFPI